MVFVGDEQAPSGSWAGAGYTVVDKTPVVREKPYLTIDGAGKYSVMVPALKSNSKGTSWGAGASAGTSLPIDTFYVAHAARGLGVYSVFNNPVALDNAIETPNNAGVKVQHMNTVFLGTTWGGLDQSHHQLDGEHGEQREHAGEVGELKLRWLAGIEGALFM